MKFRLAAKNNLYTAYSCINVSYIHDTFYLMFIILVFHPTLGAIQSAGQFGRGGRVIPEVCIYFDRKLLRGNRASKVAADRFKAYDSPNFPPLVEMEVEEQVKFLIICLPWPVDLSFSMQLTISYICHDILIDGILQHYDDSITMPISIILCAWNNHRNSFHHKVL